ncbi:MAG: hypothetical protein R2789_13210 [Microthrixaceae bacterium]
MTTRLVEGSEAVADAMMRAGCRFFAGYPMTPFTEVLEHMAAGLPELGGVCVNAESELEAVGMVWGAAAAGARAATGSTGQGLSLMQESISEASMAGVGFVVLNMARGQGAYFQATRGGGHGDYRTPVLAPTGPPRWQNSSPRRSTWPTGGATRSWWWATTTWHTPGWTSSPPLTRRLRGPPPDGPSTGAPAAAGPRSSSRLWAPPSNATVSATTWPPTTTGVLADASR